MPLYERSQLANPPPSTNIAVNNKSLWGNRRRSSVCAIPPSNPRPESRTDDAYEIAVQAAHDAANASRLPHRSPIASSSPSSWNLATMSGERPAFLDEPIREESRLPRSHSRMKSLGSAVAIPSWLNVVKGASAVVRRDSVEEQREGPSGLATTPGKKRFPSFKFGGKGSRKLDIGVVPPTPMHSEPAHIYSHPIPARSSTSLSTDVPSTIESPTLDSIPVPPRSLHDYQLTPKSSTTSQSSHFRFPSTISSFDSAASRSDSPSNYAGVENDPVGPEFGAKKENWRGVFGQKSGTAGGDRRRRLSSMVTFGGGGGVDGRDRMSSIVSSNDGEGSISNEWVSLPASESTFFVAPSDLISQMKSYKESPAIRRVPPPTSDFLAPLSPPPRNLRTPKKSPSSRSFLSNAPPASPSAHFVDSKEIPTRRVS